MKGETVVTGREESVAATLALHSQVRTERERETREWHSLAIPDLVLFFSLTAVINDSTSSRNYFVYINISVCVLVHFAQTERTTTTTRRRRRQ